MLRSLLLTGIVSLTFSLMTAPVFAQGLAVGDDVADLECRNWINQPAWASFSELKGDVILVRAWGLDNVPSMRQLSEMNDHAKKPGLHVVSLYAQVHKLSQIEDVVTKNSIKYPVALDCGDTWIASMDGMALPRTWIIGTDGKIKFAGVGEYAEVLAKELATVKYPGLGLDKVPAALEPAAKAFAEGKFADAYKMAEKIYDDTDDSAVEEAADAIMDRIDDRLSTLSVRAETSEVMKDYELAIRAWTELLRYKGLDDAAEAPERLKKLQDDKEVKKEIEARKKLRVLTLDLDVEFQAVDDADAEAVYTFREKCLKAYEKFMADNKGTGAADLAGTLAENFRKLLGLDE